MQASEAITQRNEFRKKLRSMVKIIKFKADFLIFSANMPSVKISKPQIKQLRKAENEIIGGLTKISDILAALSENEEKSILSELEKQKTGKRKKGSRFDYTFDKKKNTLHSQNPFRPKNDVSDDYFKN